MATVFLFMLHKTILGGVMPLLFEYFNRRWKFFH